jgi:hypothetical protein
MSLNEVALTTKINTIGSPAVICSIQRYSYAIRTSHKLQPDRKPLSSRLLFSPLPWEVVHAEASCGYTECTLAE